MCNSCLLTFFLLFSRTLTTFPLLFIFSSAHTFFPCFSCIIPLCMQYLFLWSYTIFGKNEKKQMKKKLSKVDIYCYRWKDKCIRVNSTRLGGPSWIIDDLLRTYRKTAVAKTMIYFLYDFLYRKSTTSPLFMFLYFCALPRRKLC